MATQHLIAYHGKPKLKAAFLTEIGKHEKADRIAHVGYAKFGKTGRFTGGCAVGCSLESMRRIEGLPEIAHSDHALYERYLGVPVMLARLEDRIFEGLPLAESLTWPRRFSDAIRPGADLSMVGWRFLHDLLTDPAGGVQCGAAKNARVKASVEATAGLFARWLETGTKPSVTEWLAAAAVAYAATAAAAVAYAATAAAAAAGDAAYAAYAAYAVAYAATAAAAGDAAYAADAAGDAAYAADAADAAADAADARASRSQECTRQAASLLRLLEAAPMASGQ